MTAEITLGSGESAITAYEARPSGPVRGGLILVQEIFGVNGHIREVADGYAADGYHVVAPALFDHVGKNIQLGYEAADVARGRELRAAISWEQVLQDMSAARAVFAPDMKVGIIGYCWGGTIAWRAATQLDGLSAAVAYYGGGIGAFAQERPHCPVQCHFGEQDQAIPLSEVEQLRQAQPEGVEIHLYPAGHGFNCDRRGSYDAESARLARERALAFLRQHVG